MEGIINDDLDRQTQRPGPNGQRPFFTRGTTVQITGAVYDGRERWFITADGTKVIGNKVELDGYSGLSDQDRSNFFVCYRAHNAGVPIIDMADAPDKLFFANLPPAPNLQFRVNELFPEVFATGVTQAVSRLPESRKHVFVYIHGFDWEPGLKLDLVPQFVQSYLQHPQNTVANVLYMGWPSYGWRKKADDRSIGFGQKFTQNGLFEYFEVLSKKLKEAGKTLNLVVHSFGHQLLNGMINPGEGHTIPTGIFENIFLMAPDVTHLAVQQGGVQLRNMRRKFKGPHFHYNYTPLKQLAKHVHIYYDPSDYLLYVSSKQFNLNEDTGNFDPRPDAEGLTTDFRNLGSYGDEIFKKDPNLKLEEGFNFYNVLDIIKESPDPTPNALLYGFLDNDDEAMAKARNGDYSDINLLKTFWEKDFLMKHHAYLFSCQPVVAHVLQRLAGVPVQTPVLEGEAPIV
ncbi:alpha/beta hydrolase [Dyadobacter sp. CY261]|uniref:alpha/beta hydrolase n=1 Tax=Dyadobacter sp. CY261 TaxID=2907203 RepID=UPI001F41887A|nr:alpha/beta hydrolase [Dyadobacter sp. CY261]MCF0074446.1 alpha/beta hydrolase [Dyadobacter sp. CY261]